MKPVFLYDKQFLKIVFVLYVSEWNLSMNLKETHSIPGTKCHQNVSTSSERAVWGLAVMTDVMCVQSVYKNKKHSNIMHDRSYLRIE